MSASLSWTDPPETEVQEAPGLGRPLALGSGPVIRLYNLPYLYTAGSLLMRIVTDDWPTWDNMGEDSGEMGGRRREGNRTAPQWTGCTAYPTASQY